MKIHGLTVCVDYADYLAVTARNWCDELDSLTIVTSFEDRATLVVAQNSCASRCYTLVHRTDAFYARGAVFNKAAAMNQGVVLTEWSDWILFFDPDILPPNNWRRCFEAVDPKPGTLYGAPRYQNISPEITPYEVDWRSPIDDREWAGYFQLFHASDPRVQQRPLLTEWYHAGGYDSDFQNLWGIGPSTNNKVRLPLKLIHLGPTGNWMGRDAEPAKMEELYRQRRIRGGYQHERITKEKAS